MCAEASRKASEVRRSSDRSRGVRGAATEGRNFDVRARPHEEGGDDDDVWDPPATSREAWDQHRKIRAAINAWPRRDAPIGGD